MSNFIVKGFLALAIAVAVTGCKIEVIVPSGGDVVSSNTAHNCSEGSVCEFDITAAQLPFSELFTAIPKAGYEFEKWSDGGDFRCANSTNPACTINMNDTALDLIAVALFDSGYAMPIFKFVGIDTDGDGVKDHLDDDDDNDGILDGDDPCPLEPNPECGINELSGIYYEDLYLRKEDGPYVIVGDVTIPEFFNLNIEAGAEVTMELGRIYVQGNLYITGTPEEPALLNNTYFFFNGTVESSIINIDNAVFEYPTPVTSIYIDSSANYPTVTITNSSFTRSYVQIYRMSRNSRIESSSFKDIPGLVFYSGDLRGDPRILVRQNTFEETFTGFLGAVDVQNNLFFRENAVAYNVDLRESPLFNYNTLLFHPSTGGIDSVRTESSAPDTDVDATNNYWGTTDYRVIDLIVFDNTDNGGYALLNYLPFLDAPHPDTPTAAP